MYDKIMKEILNLQKTVLKIADKLDSVSDKMDELEFIIAASEEEEYYFNEEEDEYGGWDQIEDYHQDFLDEYDDENY